LKDDERSDYGLISSTAQNSSGGTNEHHGLPQTR